MTDEQRRTFRILDASANRAAEGLRTIEEFARFVLDDADLTGQMKSLRHELSATLKELDRQSLLQSRDTEQDVGTCIREPSEYSRVCQADVVAAAAARTQQSLRVLEEYGKTVNPVVAAAVEQIRYRCYSVNAEIELRIRSRQRPALLHRSHLYVLIDAGPTEEVFVECLTRLVGGPNGGPVDVVQLRDRHVDDRTLLERARAGTMITRQHGKLFIMNDRCDLAVAADTDGVHVGQDEMPAGEARRIVGPSRLIGVSTHSIEQARQAVADGADYIGCGPVFRGTTKQFDSYPGTEFLSRVSGEVNIPAFAIGGIDHDNLQQVIDAGFDRIAVTGVVRDAADPSQAAVELKRRLLS